MEDQCMIMCGDWFVVMETGGEAGSSVRRYAFERNSREQLHEFDIEEDVFVAALSYWPPTSLEIKTGIRTPLVLLTSEERYAVSKPQVVNLEDVEFIREVERVEEEINDESSHRKETDGSGSSAGEDDVVGEVDVVDERDIRPRGYDKEFWSPLLNGSYGGFNAVNILYNDNVIVDG
ncbi:unnamed protein product [Eruca vesicaria subsp. sativa]|uniref:Uncharacterized protein n=1 Tax=Eruca vesicaria subsp. sativa TaxID=29727 RepID=A0ABC8JQ72_ERUVS|nr:unnamed protein product [Eruca vesicaria subsp. sativa]